MKQETLEEAVEEYVKDSSHTFYELKKQCFLDGAKWQQQQQQDQNKYSEEEVHNIITSYKNNKPKVFLKVFYNEWFKQFKKK